MARRGIPKGQVSWHLREWMDHLNVKQRDMVERAGWSKATASQLYNGDQDYSPRVVAQAAVALHVAPFELLMKPEQAMALRRLREGALRVVEDTKALGNDFKAVG
jgi:transcriptional regulator with XRE-family HTH domain